MAQSYTAVSVDSVPTSSNTPKRKQKVKQEPTGITSHRLTILWSWFVLTVPLTALTAVFLALVFRNRVSHGFTLFESLLEAWDQESHDAYYVNMNSSVLLFVTSWASSLGHMLSGFLITLASFPIARRLLQDIQRGRIQRLPTPYQLALLLKFLDGGSLGATWSWLVYLVSWGKKRQRQTPPLTMAASAALLATLLGLLVSLADTWLHLTTTTVSFAHVTSIYATYSFGLTPQCLQSNNSIAGQRAANSVCSVSVAATGAFLANATVSLGVMDSVSSLATVSTHEANQTSYAYLGIPDSPVVARRDFAAETYGASTQCALISSQCNLTKVATTLRYNCSSGFAGYIENTDLTTGFFPDARMTDDTKESDASNYGTGNPFYYAVAGILSASGGHVPNSTEFVQNESGPYGYVLGCHTTIHDIRYHRVNNAITRFAPAVSNTSASNIWQTSISQTVDWEANIQDAIGIAAFSATGPEFSETVARAFSQVVIALGADGIEARPSDLVQEEDTLLVARVPKAPLFTLVAVNALYIVCGVVFAALALWTARHEAPDLHARLGITGLVADRFEDPGLRRETQSVDDMFEEYAGQESRRVAIDPSHAGGVYVYRTVETMGSSSGVQVHDG
ncbi:hypothetical protein BO71DRAFT_402603 [Aspergillus ellipticus CBS 707.79]|uniref:Uncharacterized protein n=1 Tax=Aspergillus ellipticus CBS 707.79 TaxID=1448320 RepID=A0A319CXP8_9EURO|nr:hypothetical protein BO71DRAFT_402603 [Aspergillus ellipticus CBS 707.79]